MVKSEPTQGWYCGRRREVQTTPTSEKEQPSLNIWAFISNSPTCVKPLKDLEAASENGRTL